MSHTPGPWKPAADTSAIFGIATNGIVHVCTITNAVTASPIDIANARLIAAAPNLLDACNGLLGLLQLIALRDDVSPSVKRALTNSHRITDAQSAIVKASSQ